MKSKFFKSLGLAILFLSASVSANGVAEIDKGTFTSQQWVKACDSETSSNQDLCYQIFSTAIEGYRMGLFFAVMASQGQEAMLAKPNVFYCSSKLAKSSKVDLIDKFKSAFSKKPYSEFKEQPITLPLGRFLAESFPLSNCT